jgi:hypothetical protein
MSEGSRRSLYFETELAPGLLALALKAATRATG